jgi:hypothetical protein
MKFSEKLVFLFTIISMYCPFLWFATGLQEKYFSVSFFEIDFFEQLILTFLTFFPLYAFVVIFKKWE